MQAAKISLSTQGWVLAKANDCNWQIIARLKEFMQVFYEDSACPPLLIGASNKGFVRREFQSTKIPQNFPNLAVCSAALLGGAKIIRSHEVREHYHCLCSLKQILKHQENRSGIDS